METRLKDSTPVKDHIRHILIKVSPDAKPEEKALALGRIAKAVQRIRAGEAFADVARDVSEDTGSAQRGGDVGDKTDGFVEPFKLAADALKPGEMTNDAIETQFGYHLIAKDNPDKKAEVEAALKKDATRQLYAKHASLEIAKTMAGKIMADIKGGKSAEDAVKAAIAPLVKAPEKLPPIAVRGAAKSSAADAGAADATVKAAGDAGAKDKPAAAEIKAPTADTDPDRPQVQVSSSFNKGGDAIQELDERRVLAGEQVRVRGQRRRRRCPSRSAPTTDSWSCSSRSTRSPPKRTSTRSARRTCRRSSRRSRPRRSRST